jgi:hypothetical protein
VSARRNFQRSEVTRVREFFVVQEHPLEAHRQRFFISAAQRNINLFCPLRAESRKSIQQPLLIHFDYKTKAPASATLVNTIAAKTF